MEFMSEGKLVTSNSSQFSVRGSAAFCGSCPDDKQPCVEVQVLFGLKSSKPHVSRINIKTFATEHGDTGDLRRIDSL